MTPRNQTVGVERPTGLWLTEPIQNNVNIRNVSHITVVTSVQPLSTGARLRLANLGCGWPSCIIIIICQPQPESDYTYRTRLNFRPKKTTVKLWTESKKTTGQPAAQLYTWLHESAVIADIYRVEPHSIIRQTILVVVYNWWDRKHCYPFFFTSCITTTNWALLCEHPMLLTSTGKKI